MEKIRRLYYLTGAMTGIASIAMQRLKVSRFNDLNDPFELMGVNVNDSAIRKAFRATRDELNKTKGLICFTQDWKSPLMWGTTQTSMPEWLSASTSLLSYLRM